MHVAIIMDGNGRWATARALPRAAGHRAGADAVRRVVRAAPSLGVRALTLYAFSAENWKRPPLEVEVLMRLFRRHLLTETRRLAEHGARLTILGRRDRLSNGMRELIARAEAETANGTVLDLRIAIDYSARDEIARAARALVERGAPITRDAIDAALGTAPSLDLVIRTGRERRLSDFLLWESAYAELHFTDVMWPDFTAAHLERAVADFHSRTRRFGALAAS